MGFDDESNAQLNVMGLFLPHPVDSKNSKVEFNVDTETLSVVLRLQWLLDFVNF